MDTDRMKNLAPPCFPNTKKKKRSHYSFIFVRTLLLSSTMKAATLLALVGSATAFAPSKTNPVSTSLSETTVSNEMFDGSTALGLPD